MIDRMAVRDCVRRPLLGLAIASGRRLCRNEAIGCVCFVVQDEKLCSWRQRRNQRETTEVAWSERLQNFRCSIRLSTADITLQQLQQLMITHCALLLKAISYSFIFSIRVSIDKQSSTRLKMAHNAIGKRLFRSGSGLQQTISPLGQRRCQSTKGILFQTTFRQKTTSNQVACSRPIIHSQLLARPRPKTRPHPHRALRANVLCRTPKTPHLPRPVPRAPKPRTSQNHHRQRRICPQTSKPAILTQQTRSHQRRRRHANHTGLEKLRAAVDRLATLEIQIQARPCREMGAIGGQIGYATLYPRGG